jgi:Zn-dependent membrane protease YugP
MMMLDKYWFVLVLPTVLIGLWAQMRMQSAFTRASRIPSRRGLRGADVAHAILKSEGIDDVGVEPAHGFLSDHYHPTEKKLRLSEPVYGSDSLAAVGVAAHEVGHAIQHARGYLPLQMRSLMVPLCQLGSWVGQFAVIGGLLLLYSGSVFGKTILFWGILGYVAVFLFTLVTVPVEYDASRRAMDVLVDKGILSAEELPEVRNVLGAAALTYVASAVSVLGTLLHLILIYNRSDE